MRSDSPGRRTVQIEIDVARRVQHGRGVGRRPVVDAQRVVGRQRIGHRDRKRSRISLLAVRREVAHLDGLFSGFVHERPRIPHLVREPAAAAVQMIRPVVDRQAVLAAVELEARAADPVSVASHDRAAEPIARSQVVVDRLVSPHHVAMHAVRTGSPKRHDAGSVIGDLDEHSPLVAQRVQRDGLALHGFLESALGDRDRLPMPVSALPASGPNTQQAEQYNGP